MHLHSGTNFDPKEQIGRIATNAWQMSKWELIPGNGLALSVHDYRLDRDYIKERCTPHVLRNRVLAVSCVSCDAENKVTYLE
jgi:hypothetical protein